MRHWRCDVDLQTSPAARLVRQLVAEIELS